MMMHTHTTLVLVALLCFCLLTETVAFSLDNVFPLCQSALSGKLAEVKSLLKRGAGVNQKNLAGLTALICASFEGHTEVVSTLLEAGADVNATTLTVDQRSKYADTGIGSVLSNQPSIRDLCHGSTALRIASEYGHKEVVSILLSYGADVNAKGYADLL